MQTQHVNGQNQPPARHQADLVSAMMACTFGAAPVAFGTGAATSPLGGVARPEYTSLHNHNN